MFTHESLLVTVPKIDPSQELGIMTYTVASAICFGQMEGAPDDRRMEEKKYM